MSLSCSDSMPCGSASTGRPGSGLPNHRRAAAASATPADATAAMTTAVSTPAADDLVVRSIALLESVGFQLVPLAHPVGAWPLLAVSPWGLTVVAPVTEKPNLRGATYSVPAGWPAGTVGLILIWSADPLPKALTLPRLPRPDPPQARLTASRALANAKMSPC